MSVFELRYFKRTFIFATFLGNYDADGYPIEEESWEEDDEIYEDDDLDSEIDIEHDVDI